MSVVVDGSPYPAITITKAWQLARWASATPVDRIRADPVKDRIVALAQPVGVTACLAVPKIDPTTKARIH